MSKKLFLVAGTMAVATGVVAPGVMAEEVQVAKANPTIDSSFKPFQVGKVNNNPNNFTDEDVTIKLGSTNKAETAGIYYSINGGQYKEYTQPLTFSKSAVVSTYVVDTDGVASKVVKHAVNIDKVAPKAPTFKFLDVVDHNGELHAVIAVNSHADKESGTRAVYIANEATGGEWSDYKHYSGKVLVKLGDTLHAKVTDVAGNDSQTVSVKAYDFLNVGQGLVAPSKPVIIEGKVTGDTRSISVSVDSNLAKQTFVSINGGEPQLLKGNTFTAKIKDKVSVYSVNAKGLASETETKIIGQLFDVNGTEFYYGDGNSTNYWGELVNAEGEVITNGVPVESPEYVAPETDAEGNQIEKAPELTQNENVQGGEAIETPELEGTEGEATEDEVVITDGEAVEGEASDVVEGDTVVEDNSDFEPVNRVEGETVVEEVTEEVKEVSGDVASDFGKAEDNKSILDVVKSFFASIFK